MDSKTMVYTFSQPAPPRNSLFPIQQISVCFPVALEAGSSSSGGLARGVSKTSAVFLPTLTRAQSTGYTLAMCKLSLTLTSLSVDVLDILTGSRGL